MTTSVDGERRLISASSSMPSIPGSLMSIIATETAAPFIFSSPSSAVPATRGTKPSSARSDERTSRIEDSSSTIRTRSLSTGIS